MPMTPNKHRWVPRQLSRWVCGLTKVQMREERGQGIASRRRDATVEENLPRFEEMTKGTEEGARWCLRAKMSVDNPNKAMRDPVIYRCNSEPHHRTGYAFVSTYGASRNFCRVSAQNGRFILPTTLRAPSWTRSKVSLTPSVRTSIAIATLNITG